MSLIYCTCCTTKHTDTRPIPSSQCPLLGDPFRCF